VIGRHWKIAIGILTASVVAAGFTFPSVWRNALRLRKAAATEEKSRRDITQPALTTPTDAPVAARLFWASDIQPGAVTASDVELSLSKKPAERAKQLIAALISRPPSDAVRTLPADTTLLQFYLLPDGTAIADFSEALSGAMPSGILSEQMAVDSIVRTLEANVSGIQRLKILVRGQEVDTLAGHVDLTGFFPMMPTDQPEAAAANASSASGTPVP
jgi:hypothetical protein